MSAPIQSATSVPTDTASSPDAIDMEAGVEQLLADPTFENAIEIFGPALLSIGQAIVALILLLIIVSFVSRWIQRLLRAGLERGKVDPTVTKFLARFAKYAVWLITIPIAFELFGVRTTSLAAVIGAGGLAIGLAMQGALSNIAAGIMLLLLRPIRIGDAVEIDGVTGAIRELGIFYTTINTWDNRVVYVPNGSVLGTQIDNKTGNDTRRVDIPIGVAYGCDLEQARTVMLEAINEHVPSQSRRHETKIWLTGFGGSSIDFDVRVWCSAGDYLSVRDQAIVALNNALEKAGIEIPFPQRTLTFAQPIRVMTETQN